MTLKSIFSGIIEPYTPKNFGKEYFDITGALQYPMFVATALGVKPLYDDWVDIDRYDEFVGICKKYGLVVEPDIIFSKPKQDKSKIIGGKNITTTFTEGKKFSKEEKEGSVHVFVSKTKEKLVEAKKFGWYSAIINSRATNKPFVDHLRYGKCLGFPDCCIDFFKVYNNWKLYNHPFEIFKNTIKVRKNPIGTYYCNNYLMDNTYFLIHHLPCSYRCEKTINFAKKVEEKIMEVEPKFIKKTIEILKNPLLVFREHNFIIFDIINIEKNYSEIYLKYKNCQYIDNPARPEETIDFFDSIQNSDNITLNEKYLIIKEGNSIVKNIIKKPEWFILDFD